jgi:hypothetical protein
MQALCTTLLMTDTRVRRSCARNDRLTLEDIELPKSTYKANCDVSDKSPRREQGEDVIRAAIGSSLAGASGWYVRSEGDHEAVHSLAIGIGQFVRSWRGAATPWCGCRRALGPRRHLPRQNESDPHFPPPDEYLVRNSARRDSSEAELLMGARPLTVYVPR